MSVYRGLERSDVYLTDYISKKQWKISGSNLGDLGIEFIRAVSGSLPYYWQEEDELPFGTVSGSVSSSYATTRCLDCGYTEKGKISICPRCNSTNLEVDEGKYNSRLAYESIKALYYSGSLGNGTFEGNTDLSLQTTLTISESRNLPTRVWRDYRDSEGLPDHQKGWENPGITVIALPEEIFGTQISPGSFQIKTDEDSQCYVEDGYVDTTGSFGDDCGYPSNPPQWTDSASMWVDPYFEDLHTGDLKDYEGVILYSGFAGTWSIKGNMKYPSPDKLDNIVVGDIVYTQGTILITQEYLRYLFDRWDAEEYCWQSEKPIFTEHVTCRVRDVDYNNTLNPSAKESLQFGDHEFTPYITTVGLYNTVGDLIAVAKLSKPVKKASNVDITFDIQIDLG